MTSETKRERFQRIATRRVDQLIADFERLGNCASKVSYEYTEDEVRLIFEELERQMTSLRERFAGKKAFSLRDDT